jgi:predicted PurR-regulated permease PerM
MGTTTPSSRSARLSFSYVVILATLAFGWLLLPFYGAILWASILAVVVDSANKRFIRILNGKRTGAAALSVLTCVCIVVLPSAVILASLTREATALYVATRDREFDPAKTLEQMWAAIPTSVRDLIANNNFIDFGDLKSGVNALVGQLSQFIATGALNVGQGTALLLVNILLMLYLLFFFVRDGADLIETIKNASPFERRHTEHFFDRFSAVAKSTVMGSIIVALVQGAISGVMFWVVGMPSVLIWSALMTLLSLLPAIGAALIWAPAAIYLVVTGAALKGFSLALVCGIANTAVDNFLRPLLVGKGIRLPDYVVLVSTIGGLASFGVNGLVIGPLIATMFFSAWSLFADDPRKPAQG